MRVAGLVLTLGLWPLLAAAWAAAEGQERIRYLGETRHLAVFIPPTAGPDAPLLLALGDPGRSARYALESWRELAEREGLVVASVSSHKPRIWLSPHDGPGLLRAVVNEVGRRHPIDRRRVYLFGSGTGGAFALGVAADQPRYFAAVASFGSGLPRGALATPGRLERELPATIFYPKRTPQFDVDALHESARVLREAGARAEVVRLDVGGDFERRGRKVAQRIWSALGSEALADEPRFRSGPGDR